MEELQPGDPERVGPYLLLGRLGAGGMGQVFLGRSPGGRLVAVKVIRPELASDPAFRVRFGREIAAARKVSGLFTAAVVDADPEARLPWLVTGYVNGPSLDQAVTEHGVLPTASVLALAAGLAEGLGVIHAAGTVHRDLKPSNVLLAADGPRVIDFGISQAADVTALTSTGTVIGSPGFMSPEQAEGSVVVGPASDIFSLGAVLVFAATGEGPFGTGTPGAQLYRVVHGAPRLDQLSDQVRPVVQRCLAKDPGQRPTAAEFLAELAAAHPSAADLTDWLPPSILPAASPLPASAGPAAPPARPAAPRVGQAPPRAATVAVAPSAEADPARTQTTATPAPPSPPVVPPGPLPGEPAHPEAPRAAAARRSRPGVRVIAMVAALAIVAAAIAVVAAAPWRSAPVLRPTGLLAGDAATTSVAFRWSGPAAGPVPDRYEIILDGQTRIGSVRGNITFYKDSGLIPATLYEFQVVAIRGGRRSRPSAALNMSTVTPPVSAAVLSGEWTAGFTAISVVPPEQNIMRAGAKWTDYWTFTPACTSGPCNVTLSGTFDGAPFHSALTRTGVVYTGSAAMTGFGHCLHPGDTHDTLHIRLQVGSGGLDGATWAAASWRGSVVVNQPYVAAGNCYASTYKASFASD